ncbi:MULTISPECIES: DUF262 domain-containing protein [Streptococcus]|jgi:hypothetical protein|uniref:DUF262 domain-containing protein n=3 Tax=Streptococcus TaxID=1301 RepID=A0A501P9F1_9STRE|nr:MULTISPECIES: DUF262 domain-containing protein [Streptococcus]RSJ89713.1 hypothetical protein D8789_06095 [Streptococcus mitis]TPD56668.1 DUF262 domain-containing protein [Streptococcus symci]TPD56970.1 DUF262 domain-containing protein [Streptococcus symci]
MAKNIEPKLRKIGDYLKLEDNTIFTIPEYQRAYSWGTDHCDKLWQDIQNFVASNNKDSYFFGTIIINCQEDDTRFGLIDGQQRTTTFLLLLKALLIKINDSIKQTPNDEDSAGLLRGLKERRRKIMGILYKVESEDITDEPNKERDGEICKRLLTLESYSINERYKTDISSILNSVDYDEAKSNVIKIPYKQKDNKYTNFFRNFNYFYTVIEELPASQLNIIAKAFTDNCEVIEIKSWQVEQAITMFNSLNSDGLPLYDADIISAKLYAIAEKDGNGKEFTNLWTSLLSQISDLTKNGIANIDSILMQHMYYTRAIRGETVSDSGVVNVTTPGLRRYYTEINKDLLNSPVNLCKDMIRLAKIWKKISEYPCVQVLLKFNENAKLFLSSYLYRFDVDNVKEEGVEIIVESLLKLFTIMELVDAGYSSKYFKTFLFAEEVKLADKEISELKIKQDFENHLRYNWDNEDIKSEILEYNKHKLVYLNEYLFAKETKSTFLLGDKYDIEHIMPLSGKNLQEIRKDAEINSEEEFRAIVNKLGNKILLEEKINRSIGNQWFRTKVSTTQKSKLGYVNSIYPLATALVETYGNDVKPYWKKDDINKATEKASNRIVRFIFG